MSGRHQGFEEAARELAGRIDRSVADAVGGEGRVAVAFSGGLDSSVLVACAVGHARVIACTGSGEGSGDSAKARDAARLLGADLVETRLTAESVAAELGGIRLPFRPTLMDRSLWCLYSLVARSARESGARVMMLGQLADELFGGYAKYVEALGERGPDAADAMMRADAAEYARSGRIRDVSACSRWVEPRFPFDEKRIVELAAGMPVAHKIRSGVRKAVLRRAAVLLGVPEELAAAPKKAAQYSSGVQRLVASSRF